MKKLVAFFVFALLVAFIGESFSQKVINMTTGSMGISKSIKGKSQNFFLDPGDTSAVAIRPPFSIFFKKDGKRDSIISFLPTANADFIRITSADIEKTSPTTILFNDADYAWLAKTGPLAGMYFPFDSLGSKYTYPGELPEYLEFNAKVWYKDEKIQRLAIVTTYRSDEGWLGFVFRFDQAEKERQERFTITNVTGGQAYFRIGGKEILLNNFGRSKPIKVYPGWYYLEESHKEKVLVSESGRLVEKEEVVTGDILIGIAFRQKEVKIINSQLTPKVSELPVLTPVPAKTSDKATTPVAPKKPIIRR